MGKNEKSSGNFNRLRDEVVRRSRATSFSDAAKEWDVISICDCPGETCVCGHEDIRWCYRIRNRVTGEELYPIGDRCIRHFGSKAMAQTATAFRDVYAVGIESAATLRRTMPIRRRDGGRFTRRAIDSLLLAGALRPRPGDGLGGLSAQGARDILLAEFNGRNGDPGRARSAHLVVEGRVRPSLWEDFGIRGSKEPVA